jgi:hypothetical protein
LSTKARVSVLGAAALAGAGAIAAIATLPTAAAAATPTLTPTCSNATLKGTYTFASDGWTVSGTGTTPFALAGTETYSGAGTAAGVVTISLNGVITPGTPNTATYHINSDCTGTGAFTNSGVTTHFDLYLSPNGDYFRFVGTDPGSVTASTENRVSR